MSSLAERFAHQRAEQEAWALAELLRDVPPAHVSSTPARFTRTALDVSVDTWAPGLTWWYWARYTDVRSGDYARAVAPAFLHDHRRREALRLADDCGYDDAAKKRLYDACDMNDTFWESLDEADQDGLTRAYSEACAEFLSMCAALPDKPQHSWEVEAARQALAEPSLALEELKVFAEAVAMVVRMQLRASRPSGRDLLQKNLFRSRDIKADPRSKAKAAPAFGGKRPEFQRFEALDDYFYPRSAEGKAAHQRYDKSEKGKSKREKRRSDPAVLKREADQKRELRAKRKAAALAKSNIITLGTTTGASNDTAPTQLVVAVAS